LRILIWTPKVRHGESVEVVPETEVESMTRSPDRKPEQAERVPRLRTIALLVVVPGFRCRAGELKMEEVLLVVDRGPDSELSHQPDIEPGLLTRLPHSRLAGRFSDRTVPAGT
jgi:hypothetical protein